MLCQVCWMHKTQTMLTLSYRNKRAEITYMGIGNGVVSYE